MSKLSKNDIERMAGVVESGGKVVLSCDGYTVSLKIGYLKNRRKVSDVIVVHVDGFIKAEWCNKECPQSIFFRKEVSEKSVRAYHPYFTTAKEALEHVSNVSNSLVIEKELTKRQWIDEAPCY